MPGCGALAATYQSPRNPVLALAPAILALPLLVWPPTARWLRHQTSKIIRQAAVTLKIDPTSWHEYGLSWEKDLVKFSVDGNLALQTQMTPRPPLALVLWLDNQYAAWQPSGRLSYGTLPTPPDCWVEIKDLRLN